MSVKTLIGNWQQTTETRLFTADEVINAYLSGQHEFVNNRKRVLSKELNENLAKVKEIGERLYRTINDMGVTCTRVFLKIEDISSFRLLILVKERDFILSRIDEVYSLLIDKELAESSDTFYFFVSLMPDKKSLNDHKVFADGYYLYYGEH